MRRRGGFARRSSSWWSSRRRRKRSSPKWMRTSRRRLGGCVCVHASSYARVCWFVYAYRLCMWFCMCACVCGTQVCMGVPWLIKYLCACVCVRVCTCVCVIREVAELKAAAEREAELVSGQLQLELRLCCIHTWRPRHKPSDCASCIVCWRCGNCVVTSSFMRVYMLCAD